MTHALHTDLYQLTMLASYFHREMHNTPASCEMFVRRLPKNRRFLVAAGLEQVIQYLENLQFTDAQIESLKEIPAMRQAMTHDFVEYLRRFRFTGTVWAMPEGTVFFQNEPVLRVEAPLAEAQLVETFILSTINHQSMIASKAARVVLAARGKPVLEFGTRRTGSESAVLAARAAYIAGFEGTSNVEAHFQFGVPARGTMAHMYIMSSPDEQVAFEEYSKTFPNSTYLVDTYDTLEGIKKAIAAAGDSVKAVRIDSGDLESMTRAARGLLNDLGRSDVKIILSSDLDEYALETFAEQDIPYDGAGIGTRLVTSDDAPSLGGVYKIVKIDGEPVAKFSESKVTYPDRKQVYRKQGADVLGLMSEQGYSFIGSEPLLIKIMEEHPAGRRTKRLVYPESLGTMRERVRSQLAQMPEKLREIERTDEHETIYDVHASENLMKVLRECRERRLPSQPTVAP